MAKTATQKDYLKTCRERVRRSLAWRRTEGYDDLWERMIDLYRGKQLDGMSEGDEAVVNITFATANVIYPTVSVSNPKFLVTPSSEDLVKAAQLAEAGVNYWWRHYRFLPEWRSAVKDSIILGHGWAKTGWRQTNEKQKRSQDAMDQEFHQLLQQQDQAVADPNNSISEKDLPSEQDVRAGIDTHETVTVEDQPFVERVSPFDMIIDPDATCERELKWIAQRIIMSWDEFQDDDRFSQAVKDSVPKTDYRRGDDENRPAFGHDHDRTDACYVEVFEYWDLRKNTMCVFCDSGDGFLIKPSANPLPYKNPFTYIPNYDVPEYFYSVGDLEGIETLQHELNDTRTALFNDRKRYIPKYLLKDGAVNSDGEDAIRSDDYNAIIKVIGNNDLREAIAPMPQSDVRSELYNQSDLIKGDINDVSGVSDYQRGALPEVRRTATEANIISDTANARAADKLANIEWRLAEVGYRILQLAQTHMDGELVARITGQDGTMNWVTFTPDEIQGEFDFEVEMGSTKPSNESQKAQRAMQLIDAIGNWIGSGYLNEVEVIKYVLYGFGIKDPDRFISETAGMPQAPPGAMPPGMPPGPPGAPVPPDAAPPGPPPGAPPPPPGAPPAGYTPDLGQFGPSVFPAQSALSGVQGGFQL